MAKVIVDNDSISIIPSTAIPSPTSDSVKVQSSNKLTVDGHKACLPSDIESQTLSVAYNAPPFVGGNGIITYKWNITANNLYKDGSKVLINSGTGTWTLRVTSPAKNPSGTPDPHPNYSGQFTISTSQSKLLA